MWNIIQWFNVEYDVISIHSICKNKIFELYILTTFN